MRVSRSKKSKIIAEITVEEIVESEEEIYARSRICNSPLAQILATGHFVKFSKVLYKEPELIEAEI
jgi:hypothetical protein